MGNGEDTLMPWLNEWTLKRNILSGRERVIQEVEKQLHPVPNGPKEMQGSQNLFLLEKGCGAALNGKLDPGTEHELVVRLQRERDELGLWGSECTSPIYHHFTITGLCAIYHNTSNVVLKELIEENLGSFFWYALRMGLGESKHGLIGMRGTGHDFAESGFPDLHFVCQYFTSGRPKDYTKLSSWKPMFKDSGWCFAGVAGGRNYELYKKAFEYAVDDNWKPWRLRSKLTLIRVDRKPVGHFYNKGINGNTPAMIAYVSGRYLPVNATIRVRQKADNSSGGLLIDSVSGVGSVMYNGIYTSLTGGGGGPQYARFQIVDNSWGTPIKSRVEILTSDLSGVSGWTQIYPSQSVPVEQPPTSTHIEPPTPPKKRKPWWMFW